MVMSTTAASLIPAGPALPPSLSANNSISKATINGFFGYTESIDSYDKHIAELQSLKEHFKKNNKVKEYSGHSGKVHSVAWNCEGRRLASGSFDKSICVFSLDAYKLRVDSVYEGHADSVDQLCWHPTSPDLFATASGDKTVRIWDCRVQKNISTINTKGENINISWAPNGNIIAVGNKEDLVSFIDIKSEQITQEQQFKFEVNEICWDQANQLFYVTNGEGCIQIHEYPSMKLQQSIKAHTANCICIEFHPTGKYFAVGSADAIVSLWDTEERSCVRTFSRLDWPVRAISFNFDGSLLACASEDLFIDISHVYTGSKVAEVPVETPTFTVAWNPAKNLLAYACDDKDRHNRDHDAGTLKLFGLPVEQQQ